MLERGSKPTRSEQLFGIDLRSLAALRISFGVLLLADLIYRAIDFRAFYTETGVMPRRLYLETFSHVEVIWSLHLVSTSVAYQIGLFAIAATAAVALLLGYRTRTATIVSWILLISVQHRQPLIDTGADMILRLLLFWSIFLPLSGPPSLDRRKHAPDAKRVDLSPASVALLVQILLIYAFAMIFKLADPAWAQLTAVEDAMHVEGVATAFGRELVAHPALLRVATAMTLVIELVLPLLAFSPWKTAQLRLAIVPSMWAFHLFGVGGTMNLGLFEFIMALTWIPFIPSVFWDRILGRDPSQPIAASAAPKRFWSRVRAGFVLFALTLIVVDNGVAIDRTRFQDPIWAFFRFPTRALALSQNWRLWSTPLRNRYYVFAACLEDGSQVDLHTEEALDWNTPRRASQNNHWWKYQLHVSGARGKRLRPQYARYLMRRWNQDQPDEKRVASLEMVKIDAHRAAGAISALPRETLWRGGPKPGACRK